MAVARKRPTLSPADVLEAAGQWDPPELHLVITHLQNLQAQRHDPPVSPGEAELLVKIYEPLPLPTLERYKFLHAKLQGATISPQEHEELLEITTQSERIMVQRAEALVQLAHLRQMSYQALVAELDLQPLPYD